MSEAGFGLSEAQLEIRDMARRLAREVYAPKALRWEELEEHLPDEERTRLAGLDLLGITLPVEHGGGGQPLLHALIVIEEIARASQIAAFPIFEASTGPARVIDLAAPLPDRLLGLPRLRIDSPAFIERHRQLRGDLGRVEQSALEGR